jgi:hypothetical protein
MHRNNAAAKDQFDDFSSFRVQGSVYEKASWSEEDFYQVSGTTPRGEYAWGTSLTFGKRGNFKPFQAGGWTATRSQDISWTDGKSMSLSIPFPNVSGDVQAVMNVKPLLAPGKLDKQRVTVSVGGTQIAQWALTHSRFQQLEFTIPGSLLNSDGPTEIHFALPDAQSPESLEIGDDKRALSLAFLKLRFDLAEPD